MAPEMVLLRCKKPPMPTYGDPSSQLPVKDRPKTLEHIEKGYTSAVDWFALGVSIFKLLTGARPFSDSDMISMVDLSSSMQDLVEENQKFHEYTRLFTKVDFPDWVSENAKDLISKLIDVDDTKRLGAGKNGVRNLKSHPFFATVDWNLLEQKHIEPPFKPSPAVLEPKENTEFPDLETMLAAHKKAFWLETCPRAEFQKYFLNWLVFALILFAFVKFVV
jgi:serine/threonine protein kinase